MQKYLLIAAGVCAAGFILFGGSSASTQAKTPAAPEVNPVSIVDGKQIITIDTYRGYHPVHVTAKGGIPTTLSFVTHNTYDCSSALVIPSMNIKHVLGPNDKYDIALNPKAGEVLRATCQMGMYPLDVSFN